MAFSVKDWKNAPDPSTPVSAEALENMESRLGNYTDQGVMTAVSLANGYTDDEIANVDVSIAPGSITNTELASNAVTDAKIAVDTVTDAKLASANNSSYKTVATASGLAVLDLAGPGSYYMTRAGTLVSTAANLVSGLQTPTIFYANAADYPVGGKSAKYRVTASASVNAQPAGGTWTVGIVSVTPSGSADNLNFTPSAFLTSVVFTNPGANATTTGASADVTLGGAGTWAFCVSNSGTQVTNSAMLLHCQLQIRNT